MLAIAEPVVDPTLSSLWIELWADERTERYGHSARSPYVERFWLGILGPSSTWLLRSISYGLEVAPSGFDLATQDTARVLGLGERTGKFSPFVRAIGRLCQFELAYLRGSTLVVRSHVPWLDRRQVTRLPESLQREHQQWEEAEIAASQSIAKERRASNVAMSSARTGASIEDIERLLTRAGCGAALAFELACWATEHHELAAIHAARQRQSKAPIASVSKQPSRSVQISLPAQSPVRS